MRFLSEKMYAHSDGYYIYICATCGRRAIVNHERDIYICKHCKGDANIMECPSSWASNLGLNEISAMNIGFKLHLQPYRIEINEADYKGVANQLRSVVQDD
jgi:hypothetical protein